MVNGVKGFQPSGSFLCLISMTTMYDEHGGILVFCIPKIWVFSLNASYPENLGMSMNKLALPVV